jgi:UPF0755 protein
MKRRGGGGRRGNGQTHQDQDKDEAQPAGDWDETPRSHRLRDEAVSAAPLKRTGRVKRLVVRVAVIAALVIGVVAGGGYLGFAYLLSAHGPSRAAKVVFLPPGSGLNVIAARLQSEGVIRNALLFRAGVRLERRERMLKAGEYAVPAGASINDIVTMMIEGHVIQHQLTFPEGLTSAMIVAALNQTDVLDGKAKAPAEGSLLPDSYQVVRGTSRQAVLDRMSGAQKELIDRLWPNRADGLPFKTKAEAITLASIVEKETGVAGERPRVAAVFVNRLKKGMRLESDPTIIYGVSKGAPLVNDKGERRVLKRSEVEDANNPYNTYKINGLPPGPICNPGADAIAAVLNPAPTSDLYFVADGSGGHAFASTLADHNKNVVHWRKIEHERLQEQE